MNCKECSRQIRMIIYRFLNKPEFDENIEALPEKFQCDKKIKINHKDSILEVVCEGVIVYTVIKDKKMIYGIPLKGSPLQDEMRGKKWQKKRTPHSKSKDRRLKIQQANTR